MKDAYFKTILHVHAVSRKFEVSALESAMAKDIFLKSQKMGLIELVKLLDDAKYDLNSFPEFSKYLENRLFSSTLSYNHADTNYASLKADSWPNGSVAQLLLKTLIQVSSGQFNLYSHRAIGPLVTELRKREKESVIRAVGNQNAMEPKTMWMCPNTRIPAPKRTEDPFASYVEDCPIKKDQERRKKEADARLVKPQRNNRLQEAPFSAPPRDIYSSYTHPADASAPFMHRDILESFPERSSAQVEPLHRRGHATPYGQEFAKTTPGTNDAKGQLKTNMPDLNSMFDNFRLQHQMLAHQQQQINMHKNLEQMTELELKELRQKPCMREPFSNPRKGEQHVSNDWAKTTVPLSREDTISPNYQSTTIPFPPPANLSLFSSKEAKNTEKDASQQDSKPTSRSAESSSSVPKSPQPSKVKGPGDGCKWTEEDEAWWSSPDIPPENLEDGGFFFCPAPPEKRSLSDGYTFL
ncbi:hypothetical protein IL306_005461 [Fusarium sp. DS 682]|nr:hypothetical protein IL306_005461 [Fusarium sp. DS 682]